MKSLAFWLLLTLAVLVPATASLAATVLSPAVVAKASCVAADLAGGCASPDAGAARVAHGHQAAPSMRSAHGEETCCDTGCGQCMVCAGCGVATVLTGEVLAGGGAAAPARHLFDMHTPRAEFLLSGQERPPRRA